MRKKTDPALDYPTTVEGPGIALPGGTSFDVPGQVVSPAQEAAQALEMSRKLSVQALVEMRDIVRSGSCDIQAIAAVEAKEAAAATLRRWSGKLR